MAAKNKPSIQQQKRELTLTIDSSRAALTTSGRDLRRRIHPVNASKRLVRKHPIPVFGAAAAVAAWLTIRLRPGRRNRQESRKSGKSWPRRFLSWGIALAGPAFRIWFLKHAKTYLQGQSEPPETDSLLGP